MTAFNNRFWATDGTPLDVRQPRVVVIGPASAGQLRGMEDAYDVFIDQTRTSTNEVELREFRLADGTRIRITRTCHEDSITMWPASGGAPQTYSSGVGITYTGAGATAVSTLLTPNKDTMEWQASPLDPVRAGARLWTNDARDRWVSWSPGSTFAFRENHRVRALPVAAGQLSSVFEFSSDDLSWLVFLNVVDSTLTCWWGSADAAQDLDTKLVPDPSDYLGPTNSVLTFSAVPDPAVPPITDPSGKTTFLATDADTLIEVTLAWNPTLLVLEPAAVVRSSGKKRGDAPADLTWYGADATERFKVDGDPTPMNLLVHTTDSYGAHVVATAPFVDYRPSSSSELIYGEAVREHVTGKALGLARRAGAAVVISESSTETRTSGQSTTSTFRQSVLAGTEVVVPPSEIGAVGGALLQDRVAPTEFLERMELYEYWKSKRVTQFFIGDDIFSGNEDDSRISEKRVQDVRYLWDDAAFSVTTTYTDLTYLFWSSGTTPVAHPQLPDTTCVPYRTKTAGEVYADMDGALNRKNRKLLGYAPLTGVAIFAEVDEYQVFSGHVVQPTTAWGFEVGSLSPFMPASGTKVYVRARSGGRVLWESDPIPGPGSPMTMAPSSTRVRASYDSSTAAFTYSWNYRAYPLPSTPVSSEPGSQYGLAVLGPYFGMPDALFSGVVSTHHWVLTGPHWTSSADSYWSPAGRYLGDPTYVLGASDNKFVIGYLYYDPSSGPFAPHGYWAGPPPFMPKNTHGEDAFISTMELVLDLRAAYTRSDHDITAINRRSWPHYSAACTATAYADAHLGVWHIEKQRAGAFSSSQPTSESALKFPVQVGSPTADEVLALFSGFSAEDPASGFSVVQIQFDGASYAPVGEFMSWTLLVDPAGVRSAKSLMGLEESTQIALADPYALVSV